MRNPSKTSLLVQAMWAAIQHKAPATLREWSRRHAMTVNWVRDVARQHGTMAAIVRERPIRQSVRKLIMLMRINRPRTAREWRQLSGASLSAIYGINTRYGFNAITKWEAPTIGELSPVYIKRTKALELRVPARVLRLTGFRGDQVLRYDASRAGRLVIEAITPVGGR